MMPAIHVIIQITMRHVIIQKMQMPTINELSYYTFTMPLSYYTIDSISLYIWGGTDFNLYVIIYLAVRNEPSQSNRRLQMSDTTVTTNVDVQPEIKKRGRKPKVANVAPNLDLVNAIVELPEIEDRRRGANPFGLSVNRLVKVLNLQKDVKPSNETLLQLTFAESIADNPMFAAQFNLFLTNLGITQLSNTTIGQNAHTVETFGNKPVIESEIVSIAEMIDYVNLWMIGGNTTLDFKAALAKWDETLIKHAYQRISMLQKINRQAYRLHKITLNGIADQSGTPTKIVMYRIEDQGERADQIVKSAISHSVGYGKYVATNDDNLIGYNQPELSQDDDTDKNLEM